MKHIDAEKLKAEIEKKIKSIESCPFIEAEFGATEKREGKIQAYKEILSFIDSLHQETNDFEYIRKDVVVDAIKLAFGKVSMNPFDCSEAFEELLNKVGYED